MVFGLDNVKVCKDVNIIGAPILDGQKMESIYVMSAESTYVDKTRSNDTMDLWHARLRHVSYQKLRIIMNKSLLNGLPQLDV